ncbi:MAG: ROK family protein, partial [Solirubrobacterales bacterium]|nr:ROK family protein [Solirubrobacterales bacterium]
IGGRRCPCGRRGCMEAYAGRAAMEARARQRVEKGEKTDLFKLMKDRGRTKLTSAVWAKALDRGDKLATDLLDEAVEALGAGIASAQNLLDVEAIVIGGGLGIRLGEPFVRRIRQAMMPHTFNDAHPPDVLVAALGDLGGALGAALLVSRRLEGEPAPVAETSSPAGVGSAGEAMAAGEAPAAGDGSAAGAGSAAGEAPAAGAGSAAGEAPPPGEAPAAGEATAGGEAPAAGEATAGGEAPAAGDGPGAEDIPSAL